MGVDAEMFVRSRKIRTEEEVRRLSYEMAEAIGPSHFFITKDPSYGGAHHALSIVTPFVDKY